MYVFKLCSYSIHRARRGLLDSLEFQSQTVVSHHVGAKNRTGQIAVIPNYWVISSAHLFLSVCSCVCLCVNFSTWMQYLCRPKDGVRINGAGVNSSPLQVLLTAEAFPQSKYQNFLTYGFSLTNIYTITARKQKFWNHYLKTKDWNPFACKVKIVSSIIKLL